MFRQKSRWGNTLDLFEIERQFELRKKPRNQNQTRNPKSSRLNDMDTGILRVQGDKIVDKDGKPVLLRGAAIGGWMK